MRVGTTTEYVHIDENEVEKKAVIVTCERCNNTSQSWGWGDNSVRRCCVELRNTCPRGEDNFYVSDVGTEDGG